MTPNPTASNGEKVEEIQALSQRVADFDRATDFWNTAMIVALILAALAAVAVVGTTVMALRRTKQTGEAQSELSLAKERQLQLALKEKDDKIAEINLARVKIEARLAWRTITDSQRKRIFEVLGEFRRQKFDIDGSNIDPELDSFSGDLRASLAFAGWIPRDSGRWGSMTPYSGVRIIVNSRTPNIPAATALADLLKSPEFGFKDIAIVQGDTDANSPLRVEPGVVGIHPGRKPRQE
jgi:hypothetical protein